MTNVDQIRLAVSNLQEPSTDDPDFYAVTAIDRNRGIWLGRSSGARACFLLNAKDDGALVPPLRMPSLRIRPKKHAVIDECGSQSSIEVCIIECLADDEQSIDLFLRCIHGVLLNGHSPLTTSGVAAAIEHLIALFRDYTIATDQEILGLWAELFVIRCAPNPEQLIAAWRVADTSRFDFTCNEQRIDVKATTRPQRRHHLSWQQANPPPGTNALFVSVKTESVAIGLSVQDLWDFVAQAAPAHRSDVDLICIRTLGLDWREAVLRQFDEQAARDSIELFCATTVPRIIHLPAGVTNCGFESDFDAAETWDGAGATGLFAQAVGCRALCRG